MKVNAEAIYETRPIAPYKEANVAHRETRRGVYAIYLADEDEPSPPSTLQLYSHRPKPGTKVEMLGYSGAVPWEAAGKGMLIRVPTAAVKNPPCRHAWAFKISAGS